MQPRMDPMMFELSLCSCAITWLSGINRAKTSPPMGPHSLLAGVFDTLFSTLDFVSLWHTVKVSAVGMIGQALNGKI